MGRLAARTALLVGALAVSSTALAEEPWQTVLTGKITVKVRPRPGTGVTETWAEGEMAAPVQDIQAAVMDVDRFPTFMPHVKEAREVGRPEPDGSRYVYTRVQPPVVSSRDYLLKVSVEQSVNPDGSGEFRNKWVAASDRIPDRHNVVRIRVNDGSWYAKPMGDGSKSWVVYKNAVDPGGWIPPFINEMANKQGISDTFNAVENEAKRRYAARRKKEQSTPKPTPPPGEKQAATPTPPVR